MKCLTLTQEDNLKRNNCWYKCNLARQPEIHFFCCVLRRIVFRRTIVQSESHPPHTLLSSTTFNPLAQLSAYSPHPTQSPSHTCYLPFLIRHDHKSRQKSQLTKYNEPTFTRTGSRTRKPNFTSGHPWSPTWICQNPHSIWQGTWENTWVPASQQSVVNPPFLLITLTTNILFFVDIFLRGTSKHSL